MATNFNTLVFLKGFDNYFNRIIKRLETLAAYEQEAKDYIIRTNRNFNPNDGVNTEHIENSQGEDLKDCDYMLVLDEDDNIVSRWFIMECQRTRNGQYKLTLKRDVLADNLEALKSSPAYIERGVITDVANNLIYNSEHMAVNQIKTKEILLTDDTKCPWLVGYIKKGSLGSEHSGTVNWDPGDGDYVEIPTTIENWEFSRYGITPMKIATDSRFVWKWYKLVVPGDGTTYFKSSINRNGPSTKTYGPAYNQYTNLYHAVQGFWQNENDANNAVTKPIYNYLSNNYSLFDVLENQANSLFGYEDRSKLERFLSDYNNKIIKDSAGRYFKVSCVRNTEKSAAKPVASGELFNSMKDIWNNALNMSLNPNTFALEVSSEEIETVLINVIEQPSMSASFTLNGTYNKSDEPLYDVICAPYGSLKMILDEKVIEADADTSLAIMNSMATALTSSIFMDLQLVPYCPVAGYLKDDALIVDDTKSFIKITQNDNLEYGVIIAKSGTFSTKLNHSINIERPRNEVRTTKTKSLVARDIVPSTASTTSGRILCPLENFTVNSIIAFAEGSPVIPSHVSYDIDGQYINYHVRLDVVYKDMNIRVVIMVTGEEVNYTYPNDLITDIKVANECDMYRLCSPNGAGAFEFSVAKNNKQIDFFTADCTYKPFNPYIHVAPNFSGLYGSDFSDFRGLICGGEFSLGILDSAWNQYELQNRNFQNIFDRQIQNMSVNHSYDMANSIVGAIAGTATGAAGGAIAGAKSGFGAMGAGVGAAIGGTVAAGAGIADIAITEGRYQENKSFTEDVHYMQLDNIKALPSNITRTSAIVANNKKFPFIEYYTCTDEEKEILRNKITYEGMTVGAIDTLDNWIGRGNYIRCQLVRNLDITDDTHIMYVINDELSKGVYL